jgi:hypothetical protein
MSISSKFTAGIVLSVLGASLMRCMQTPTDPPVPYERSSTSDPIAAPDPIPSCDVTAPLNHCGAYMPQFCQSCGN